VSQSTFVGAVYLEQRWVSVENAEKPIRLDTHTVRISGAGGAHPLFRLDPLMAQNIALVTREIPQHESSFIVPLNADAVGVRPPEVKLRRSMSLLHSPIPPLQRLDQVSLYQHHTTGGSR
jgi:hypothetical protein